MKCVTVLALMLITTLFACGASHTSAQPMCPDSNVPTSLESAPTPAPSVVGTTTELQDQLRQQHDELVRKHDKEIADRRREFEESAAAAEQARKAKLRQLCGETRQARAADLQAQARDVLEFVRVTSPHRSTIVQNCRIPVRTELQPDSHTITGFRVIHQNQAPICRGGNPGGLSAQTIHTILVRHEVGLDDIVEVEPSDQFFLANRDCESFDKEAGLALNPASLTTVDSLKKLVAWRPEANQ